MLVPVPLALPLTPATTAVVQLITAPLVVLLNAILVDAGLQITGALFVTVSTGFGLTTTLTFCVVPVHVTPAFVKLVLLHTLLLLVHLLYLLMFVQ
jgi:hypothetical protein